MPLDTDKACPVAIGHRDSIQQEMLKRYLSDLLGELCLSVSVVPLPGFCPCSITILGESNRIPVVHVPPHIVLGAKV